MLVTIEYAEEMMTCRLDGVGDYYKCIADSCMHWRWHDKAYEDGGETGEGRRGYCGFSGLPGKGEAGL